LSVVVAAQAVSGVDAMRGSVQGCCLGGWCWTCCGRSSLWVLVAAHIK
jgi:hypothetical protein